MQLYDQWPSPIVIVSDGAYGLSLFPSDPPEVDDLPKWYEPHIKKWSEKATPLTTLWFWNREVGWATIHPILVEYGWQYVSSNTWVKGIQHIAGNSNTETLRRFPQVTEVCVQYVRKAEFKVEDRIMNMKDWLRFEWNRSGLPLCKANQACGVKNAASRKYLTKDHLWYYPPPEEFGRLVEYANRHGDPNGRPFFSADGEEPLTEEQWSRMRSKFHCELGVTNVWEYPPLHGSERLRRDGRAIHLNQKPIELTELIIRASSDEDDVIWEPFGGLCTAAIASLRLNRKCVSAEVDSDIFKVAGERLRTYGRDGTQGGRAKGLDAFFAMEEG